MQLGHLFYEACKGNSELYLFEVVNFYIVNGTNVYLFSGCVYCSLACEFAQLRPSRLETGYSIK